MRFLLRPRGRGLRRRGLGASGEFSRCMVSCTALPSWSRWTVRPGPGRPCWGRPGRSGCWSLLLLEQRAQSLLRVVQRVLRRALTADHRVDNDVRDPGPEGADADRAGVVRVPVVDTLVDDLLGEGGH